MADLKRSVKIGKHSTSISLEDEFWDALTEIAQSQGKGVQTRIVEVDRQRAQPNLSSAVRLFILDHYVALSSGGTRP